jgi:hypothetical protein
MPFRIMNTASTQLSGALEGISKRLAWSGRVRHLLDVEDVRRLFLLGAAETRLMIGFFPSRPRGGLPAKVV